MTYLNETCPKKSNEYELNTNLAQTDNDVKMQTKYDFKDSLLASLYSQVEFLRGEIEKKNLLTCYMQNLKGLKKQN